MSQDYDDYVQLRGRNRWLAFASILRDRLYYLGQFGGFFTAVYAPIEAVFTRIKGAHPGPGADGGEPQSAAPVRE